MILDKSEDESGTSAFDLPDWLKLRLLQSDDQRFVIEAVSHLPIEKNIQYLMSFGTSKVGAEHLLMKLDEYTISSPTDLNEMMGKLGCRHRLTQAVRSHRSCKGKSSKNGGSTTHGQKFLSKFPVADHADVDIKEDGETSDTEMQKPQTESSAIVKMDVSERSSEIIFSHRIDISTDEIEEILEGSLFSKGHGAGSLQSGSNNWMTLLHNIQASSNKGDTRIVRDVLTKCSDWLNKTSGRASARKGIEANRAKWISLLRIVKRMIATFSNSDDQMDIVNSICENLEKHKSTTGDAFIKCLQEIRLPTGLTRASLSVVKKQEEQAVAELAKLPDVVQNFFNVSTAVTTTASSVYPLELQQQAVIALLKPVASDKHSSQSQEQDKVVDTAAEAHPAMSSIISWLILLDPEIVRSTLEHSDHPQLAAIFGARGIDAQQELLSLLPHGASIGTLRSVIDRLLIKFQSEYQACRVLDFISACVHLPKIWRGRERKNPRHAQLEDVLNLNYNQIQSLILYCLAEIEHNANTSSASDDARRSPDNHSMSLSSSWTPDYVSKPYPTKLEPDITRATGSSSFSVSIKKRVPLLLRCCSKDTNLSAVAILLADFVQRKQKAAIATNLLLEIYLQRPQIQRWIPGCSVLNLIVPEVQADGCKLDDVCHRLIMELYSACDSNQIDDVSTIIDPTLKKLATLHPGIFIRQLSLIGALLRGLTTKSSRQLNGRDKSYNVFIAAALDYTELVDTLLFDPYYIPIFQDLMVSFFEVIEFHALRTYKLISLVDRVLGLLVKFHRLQGEPANKFLQGHASLLQAVSFRFPCIPQLTILMSEVTLPFLLTAAPTEGGNALTDAPSSSSGQGMAAGGPGGLDLEPCSLRPPSPSKPNVVSQVVLRLRKHETVSDLLATLQEIEEESQRKPDGLHYFTEMLRELMSHWHKESRELAYTLLLRHLCRKPQLAIRFLPTYMSCLDSNNLDIVETSLRHLPDFIIVCRERAPMLLEKAFLRTISVQGGDGWRLIDKCVQILNFSLDKISTAENS